MHDVLQCLGIKYPIISAPMARIAGAKLATAVSEAGGLGLIGGGYCDPTWLLKQLNLAGDKLYGVGFITWRLKENPHVLDMALERKLQAIMLSFGDIEPYVTLIKARGIPLICQVQSVAEAKACYQKGADIIVAQGTEAGGHGGMLSTMALTPAIVDAVKPLPVVAAGGISDARGMKAALALGAKGVLMGTRFMASEESEASDKAKALMVTSKACDTVRTRVFDYARGYDWPKPYTARVLKNQFTETWHGKANQLSLLSNETQQALYADACRSNDFDIAGLFIGEGIDLIHEILPAAQIVQLLTAALSM